MAKLMTLNINGYQTRHGNWEQRKSLIRRIISWDSPDVLALQAVRRDPNQFEGRDQASQLAGFLKRPATVHYHPATSLEDGSQEGSALISYLPEILYQHKQLSLGADCEDKTVRLVLRADYLIGGEQVSVYNCHFSWIESENRRNIEEALHFLGNPARQKAILCGDLNSTSAKDGPKILRNQGWVDTWEIMNPGRRGLTFESHAPEIRIDYIFATPALCSRVQFVEVVEAESPDGNIRISDHLGLLITLDM